MFPVNDAMLDQTTQNRTEDKSHRIKTSVAMSRASGAFIINGAISAWPGDKIFLSDPFVSRFVTTDVLL